MQLTVWTYEAPPHVGAMRIATAMQGVHYVLHAPQGDTYADLLFTMIERQDKRVVDCFIIEIADGHREKIYFDITKFAADIASD